MEKKERRRKAKRQRVRSIRHFEIITVIAAAAAAAAAALTILSFFDGTYSLLYGLTLQYNASCHRMLLLCFVVMNDVK